MPVRRTSLPMSFPLGCLAAVLSGAGGVCSEWPQWGGPTRDFHSPVKGLPESWPPAGPAKLWSRPLGEGYSGIAVTRDMLVTMYRKGDAEVVVALNAASGKTIWEYSYKAPFLAGMDMQNGPGPHSTPLVINGRVYAVGATGKLHCLQLKTGKLLWEHRLIERLKGSILERGYSASPLAYKTSVILPVGGKGRALVAFHQATGAIIWSGHDSESSNSSPILIDAAGRQQLVAFLAATVAGLNPDTGAVLWSHPHRTEWNLNVATPVWNGDGLLFISSAYNGGSRVLKLTSTGPKVTVSQLWANPRVRVHFTNAVRIDDHLYTSSGDFGPAFLTAVDVKSGKIAWQRRGLPRASMLYADSKLILLDEDGNLSLAKVSPQQHEIKSSVKVLDNNAWTAPSIAGSRLYLRDRKQIIALDLTK